MAKDFTIAAYTKLLNALQKSGYAFITFEDWCVGKVSDRYVILRHDVDMKSGNSLITARVEAVKDIRATYYFRIVPQSNQPTIIRSIARMKHEIGYHYEDLSIFRGNKEQAIEHFSRQLAYFRLYYPVRTACMHGSPTSRYDNRDLWEIYNYRDFGIIGEPYFDIDFNKVFYLTDTGRCWDGEKYSVRDKVKSGFKQSYHITNDIIKAAKNGSLPECIMITTHPQRWTDNRLEWLLELVTQNVKNIVKRFINGK